MNDMITTGIVAIGTGTGLVSLSALMFIAQAEGSQTVIPIGPTTLGVVVCVGGVMIAVGRKLARLDQHGKSISRIERDIRTIMSHLKIPPSTHTGEDEHEI